MLFLFSLLTLAEAPEPPAPPLDAEQESESDEPRQPLVVGAQIRKRGLPRYPTTVREQSAFCVLELEVNRRGRVKESTVQADSRCPSAFAESAEKAGRDFLFYPALVDGQPVPCTFTVRIQFRAE